MSTKSVEEKVIIAIIEITVTMRRGFFFVVVKSNWKFGVDSLGS